MIYTEKTFTIEKIRHLRRTMVGKDEHVKVIIESLMDHIIESNSNDYMMAQYALISNFLWRAGRTAEGKYYVNKAKYYAEYAVDKESLFDFYIQAGNYEYADDSYSRAGSWYFKAVEIAEQMGLEEELARVYNNIGSLFLNNAEYEKGLEYYKMAEVYLECFEDKRVMPMLYSNLSELYLLSGNYCEAKKYIEIAEPYVIENGSPIRLFNHEINKWRYYLHEADLAMCEICFQNASHILTEIPIGNDYVVGVLAIFDNLITMDYPELAIGVLERGIESLEVIDDYPNLKKFYHHMLIYYEEQNNEKKCLDYMTRIINVDRFLRTKRSDKRKEMLKGIDRDYRAKRREREAIDYTVTTLSSQNSHLHALNNHLKSIHDIGVNILSTTNLSDIYSLLLDRARSLFYSQDFAIALYDEASKKLVFRYEDIVNNIPAESFTVSTEDRSHLSVQCFIENREIIINDFEKYNPTRYRQFIEKGITQQSLCYIPIAIEGDVFGIMTAQDSSKNAFDETHLEIFRLLATFAAVSFKNAKQNKQLKYLARHDALTNLYNRRTFEDVYKEAFEYSKLNKQPITLMLLDVDYFKQYNDTYGHVAGDACLVKISELLLMGLEGKDACLARYGGDEFVVLLKGHTRMETQGIIETLIESVRRMKLENSQSKVSDYVSISLGAVNKVVGLEDTADKLLIIADQALYKTKKELGRNGYNLV